MVKSVVNFSHLRSDPSHPAVSSSQFLVIFCHFTKYKKINLLQKIQYLQVIYKVRQLQECTCCHRRHRCPSWGHCRTCFGVQRSTPPPPLSLGYSQGAWALTLVVIVAHAARSACVGPLEVIAVTGDTRGQLL